jgi:isoquinoline 1-oxidoreductase beta subunit
LLHAVVLHPPRFGAWVKALDANAARRHPGVVDVLIISRGVAVVADTFFDGLAALRDLVIQWDDAAAERRGSAELLATHYELARSGTGALAAYVNGDVEAALSQAAYVIEAFYDVPYLAQAPLEPNNAACRMREDGVLEVWAGYQAPDYARSAAAAGAGLPKERVEVHVTFAGGGFGLRSSGDPAPVIEAAEVCRALGWKHPIKVQWPRQEEFKYGCYRPMAVMRLRAGIDATGVMTALDHRIVVQSVAVDMPKLSDMIIRNGVDGMSVEGAVDQPYAIANHRVDLINFKSGVHVATMRAVGHTQNEFAREALIDEAAATAGVDALAYRRRLLAGNPRLFAVLERAAAAANWDGPLAAGRARGLAVSNSFRSFSALIAEISQDDKGRVRVDRFVFAIDCGRLISPDFVRAQAEGGILFGLSAAVWDEVVLNGDGSVRTQNFDGYPIARMRDAPAIEVLCIDSDEEPGGVGEVSVASVAPALVNAVAALRGVRIRSLPIAKSIDWSLTALRAPAVASPVTSTGGSMADEVKIVTTQNGPYQVTGSITVHDYDGRNVALPSGNEVYLCRCGASANKPFCDGSHVTVGFDGSLAKQR